MATLTPAASADLFRAEPDRFLDVGAGEVAYRRVGTGPDVLFVHGWPVSGATFRLLLPHLVDHVTCHVIDLPGAGSSRFTADTPLSIDQHITSVRRVVDLLELDEVAVVGHDSGGMIARHAVAGDPRLRAMGLINTEQPHGLSWRFKLFLAGRKLPGFGAGPRVGGRSAPAPPQSASCWAARSPTRRCSTASSTSSSSGRCTSQPERRRAAIAVLRSFDAQHVRDLADVHRRITVPVQLVWGDQDPFFPLAWAEEMVGTFPDARLEVIRGAGLFSHEERPAEVARALLPVLVGTS